MKIFLTLFLCALTTLGTAQDESKKLYGEARQAERRQEWSKAESLYGKAIQAEPENATYYYSRGNLNMLLGRDGKALVDINKAVELEPNNPKNQLLKAQFFIYTEKPDSAMLYVQNAEALEKSKLYEAKTQIARGDVYRLLLDYKKASEQYEPGLAVDTANVEGLENMSLVLYELGDQKQAAHYLQRLLKVNPDIIDTYINVGYIYARIGMYLESLSYSEEALKFDPQQPIALANKAYAEYKMESYKDAAESVNKSLKNNPANPFALKTRALITLATDGKVSKACKDLKQAQKYGYDKLFNDGEVEALLQEHCK